MRRLSSRMGNAEAYAIIQGFAVDVEAIEADRQRTREVVQALVDAAAQTQSDFDGLIPQLDAALSSAKSQLNIEPTKP